MGGRATPGGSLRAEAKAKSRGERPRVAGTAVLVTAAITVGTDGCDVAAVLEKGERAAVMDYGMHS